MRLKIVDPLIHDQIGFTKIMLDDVIVLEDTNIDTFSYPDSSADTDNKLFWLDGVATVYILDVFVSNWAGTNEWDGAGALSVTLNVQFQLPTGWTTSAEFYTGVVALG